MSHLNLAYQHLCLLFYQESTSLWRKLLTTVTVQSDFWHAQLRPDARCVYKARLLSQACMTPVPGMEGMGG
jgi:hypothetical protein